MARTELERTVQPSVLDRLTDLTPREPLDDAVSRAESLMRYRVSVQRDVEWLLNTRRTIVTPTLGQSEVRQSVHQYGLPDTTGLAVATEAGRAQLREDITDTLARFEPRLTRVSVEMNAPDALNAPSVRFTIRALLRLDPSPERVTFDTVLDLSNGTYAVREGDDMAG